MELERKEGGKQPTQGSKMGCLQREICTQLKKNADLTRMGATLGHCGPENGQGLLLHMRKVLGTPNTLKEVGLS